MSKLLQPHYCLLHTWYFTDNDGPGSSSLKAALITHSLIPNRKNTCWSDYHMDKSNHLLLAHH